MLIQRPSSQNQSNNTTAREIRRDRDLPETPCPLCMTPLPTSRRYLNHTTAGWSDIQGEVTVSYYKGLLKRPEELEALCLLACFLKDPHR